MRDNVARREAEKDRDIVFRVNKQIAEERDKLKAELASAKEEIARLNNSIERLNER